MVDQSLGTRVVHVKSTTGKRSVFVLWITEIHPQGSAYDALAGISSVRDADAVATFCIGLYVSDNAQVLKLTQCCQHRTFGATSVDRLQIILLNTVTK